jgi:hypothetical protein
MKLNLKHEIVTAVRRKKVFESELNKLKACQCF